ncbi:MAG: DinB family protein [Longimicrobiales bacterium]
MAELLGAVETVEQKLVGLAEAIPADKYGWRPGEGVRSVGEVVMHVAADNYLLPAMAGTAAPAATGIKADDYSSVQKYEQTVPAKDAAIAAMKESFAHLRQAMAAVPEDRLGESVSMFGQQSSLLGLWVLTTTHLHEHLGQMIAYARSNSIVPPWSR